MSQNIDVITQDKFDQLMLDLVFEYPEIKKLWFDEFPEGIMFSLTKFMNFKFNHKGFDLYYTGDTYDVTDIAHWMLKNKDTTRMMLL
jgi:hypothetical protein